MIKKIKSRAQFFFPLSLNDTPQAIEKLLFGQGNKLILDTEGFLIHFYALHNSLKQ